MIGNQCFGVRVPCPMCRRSVGVHPGGYVRRHNNQLANKLRDGRYPVCDGSGQRVKLDE